MRADLGMFDAADLYEYACPEGSQNPQLASGEQLIERAEQRVRDWMRNTSERSAAERLCSRAREVFGDEAERRRYDEYLQWRDLKTVFDDLGNRLDPAISSCTDEDVAPEIMRLRELLGSRSQAEALMESYLASRGIAFVDSHDLQVSTANGRAQVREELAASNLLPDSAFEPSTPAPPTAPIVIQDTGDQAGVVRRCVCGNLNEAGQNFCQACGRPLSADGQPVGGAPQPSGAATRWVAPAQATRPVETPAAGRRTFPVAAVIVAVVIIVAIGGGLAFFFMSGMSESVLGGGSSASASSELSKNTKRIQSGSVKEVECSGKTVITPYDVDEEPVDSYSVDLNRKQDGVSIDNTLLVRKAGGGAASFTISQFNDPNGKTLENVPDGTYEVVMKSEDGKTVCTFIADYKESNKDAAAAVEVVATK